MGLFVFLFVLLTADPFLRFFSRVMFRRKGFSSAQQFAKGMLNI